ncbi:MAG: hypothetical protein AB1705_21700 [Verrucomicrobiota bacterium]
MEKLGNIFAEIAGHVGRFVRTFVVAYALAIGLGLLTAVAMYYAGAAHGSSARGTTSAIVALAAFLVIGFLVGMKLTIFLTLARMVAANRWGARILNALFEELMGVTPEKPEGDLDLTKQLHGTPVREVRTRLKVAARGVLQHKLISATLPRFARWLARQAARALVWVTVRIIVANCAAGHGPDDTIDLIVVRDRLGERIDGMVIERLRQESVRFALLLAAGLVLLNYLLAVGLRNLPLG